MFNQLHVWKKCVIQLLCINLCFKIFQTHDKCGSRGGVREVPIKIDSLIYIEFYDLEVVKRKICEIKYIYRYKSVTYKT